MLTDAAREQEICPFTLEPCAQCCDRRELVGLGPCPFTLEPCPFDTAQHKGSLN